MEFTGKEWVELLLKERRPNGERVIVTSNFHRVLRINEKDRENCFAGFGGIAFQQGKEIEIVANKSGGPEAEIPE